MIVFIYLLPPLLNLVASVVIAYLVMHSLLTGPTSAVFAILQIIMTAVAAFCLWTAWKEAIEARREISAHLLRRRERESIRRPHAAPMRYALSQTDRASVDRVLGALQDASILDADEVDRAALVDRMEQEGFGTDICAYEVMLTLGLLEEETGRELAGLAFTKEQVEIEPDDIAKLSSKILAIMGFNVPTRDIRIPLSGSSDSTGTVVLTYEGREISLPCTFHSKHTPDGLIEGLAREFPLPNGKDMCWESIDSSIVVACLTPTAMDAFNATMGDDQFRFARI